jgi:hypothetical protein
MHEPAFYHLGNETMKRRRRSIWEKLSTARRSHNVHGAPDKGSEPRPHELKIDGLDESSKGKFPPLPPDLAEELERKFGQRVSTPAIKIHVLSDEGIPLEAIGRYISDSIPVDTQEPISPEERKRLPDRPWE